MYFLQLFLIIGIGITSSAFAEVSLPENQEVITNMQSGDGFGSQFQFIVAAVFYAEFHNQKFIYTPFKVMEHNYDNDSEFLDKKEKLINFMNNFEVNRDPNFRPRVSPVDCFDFFLKNLELCSKSGSLKNVKKVFRANKNKNNYFDKENWHVAVHIRRPNPQDNRIEGTNTPDHLYLRLITTLREAHKDRRPLFHIYSQGERSVFKSIFDSEDIILHINDSVEETFTSLVLADALVTGASSFSYIAAILSDGIIYYVPFWHPPMPHWNCVK